MVLSCFEQCSHVPRASSRGFRVAGVQDEVPEAYDEELPEWATAVVDRTAEGAWKCF